MADFYVTNFVLFHAYINNNKSEIYCLFYLFIYKDNIDLFLFLLVILQLGHVSIKGGHKSCFSYALKYYFFKNNFL